MKKNVLFIFSILWIGILFIAYSQFDNTKLNVSVSKSENHFVWFPEKNEDNISNVANRYNFGIIGGDEKMLFFQSFSKSNNTEYSLYSYNLINHSVEELSADCYGMINVTNNSVYYIGYEKKGVFRYDSANRSSKLIYSGDVRNLLATKAYLYLIDSKNVLLRMDLSGNNIKVIMKEVSPHYLDCNNGYLYFSQFVKSQVDTYNLYKSAIVDKIKITQIYSNIPYPIKYWDNKILFKDLNGVYLLNLEIVKKINLNINSESCISVNGNGIFLTNTDRDGYTELKVYDLNTSKTYNLTPTHYNLIYFINDKIYMVNVANFKAEVVDFTNPDYIHPVRLEL